MLKVVRIGECGSTNLEARGREAFSVVAAERQTAGRGRLDHRWHSTPGANLTFSAVLPRHSDAEQNATMTLMSGLAVAEALGDGFEIKWPNDVYYNGRKVCGILCELDGDNVIVGIGINVNETEFPPELAGRATSLALIRGKSVDREAVMREVLQSLDAHYRMWLETGLAGLMEAFEKRDFLRGREVCVMQTDGDMRPACGIVRGIRKDGALMVGDEAVFAGEVRLPELPGEKVKKGY